MDLGKSGDDDKSTESESGDDDNSTARESGDYDNSTEVRPLRTFVII